MRNVRNVTKCFMLIVLILSFWTMVGCGEEEEKANTAPVISSFLTEPASVVPKGQVALVVSASDAENDPLVYTYQSSGGSITGTGDKVMWVAPEAAGSYVINVAVSDSKLSAQSSVTITVIAPEQEKPVEKLVNLKIQWFGQSCFLITSTDGKHILTDPFSSGIGYTVPSIEADVVLISHSHGDHNNVSMAKGSPEVIRTTGESIAAGIKFLGVQSDHDSAGGASRGKNVIFIWEMDGIRMAHLGDLGQPALTDSQMAEIGKVDILFIPVGGNYTIDANQATKVMEQLSPKLVFPMHYKTDVATSAIASVDGFLAGKDNVEKINTNFIVVEKLPDKTKIIVLNYK